MHYIITGGDRLVVVLLGLLAISQDSRVTHLALESTVVNLLCTLAPSYIAFNF